MTKQDFELIAAVLKAQRDTMSPNVYADLCGTFAKRLALTNKQFNFVRFVRACGCQYVAAYKAA